MNTRPPATTSVIPSKMEWKMIPASRTKTLSASLGVQVDSASVVWWWLRAARPWRPFVVCAEASLFSSACTVSVLGLICHQWACSRMIEVSLTSRIREHGIHCKLWEVTCCRWRLSSLGLPRHCPWYRIYVLSTMVFNIRCVRVLILGGFVNMTARDDKDYPGWSYDEVGITFRYWNCSRPGVPYTRWWNLALYIGYWRYLGFLLMNRKTREMEIMVCNWNTKNKYWRNS